MSTWGRFHIAHDFEPGDLLRCKDMDECYLLPGSIVRMARLSPGRNIVVDIVFGETKPEFAYHGRESILCYPVELEKIHE